MTSVKGFRHEADMQLSRAAEARNLLCASLDLAKEKVSSLTSQLAALGPSSQELQLTLEQVRNNLLMATKAATAAHEATIGAAQKLSTHLERLWPWMKQRHDEISEAHRLTLEKKGNQEQAFIEMLRTIRKSIIIVAALLVPMIGASAWIQWQKLSTVQQANAMCLYGERLMAIMPVLPPGGQEWVTQQILTPRPRN